MPRLLPLATLAAAHHAAFARCRADERQYSERCSAMRDGIFDNIDARRLYAVPIDNSEREEAAQRGMRYDDNGECARQARKMITIIGGEMI